MFKKLNEAIRENKRLTDTLVTLMGSEKPKPIEPVEFMRQRRDQLSRQIAADWEKVKLIV